MSVFVTANDTSTVGLQNTRPKLTDEQKAQLKVCFDLMDADGSGSIDADELSDAFELLGMNLSRAEIQVNCMWPSAEWEVPALAQHRVVRV